MANKAHINYLSRLTHSTCRGWRLEVGVGAGEDGADPVAGAGEAGGGGGEEGRS